MIATPENVIIPPTAELTSLGDFRISRGFNETLAAQLVEKSQQPAVKDLAPRDALERFPDTDAALEWFNSSPNRVFYNLAYRAHLAGVMWFTQTPLDDAKYTFAARIYEPFAGKGIGSAFGHVVHDDLRQFYEGSTWADVLVRNIASQKMAYKLGYRRIIGRTSPDPDKVQIKRLVAL